MKRLLSWLLALVMIISCLPMSVLPAFAAEPGVDTGTEDPDFGLDMWELLPGGSAENRLLVQFTMNAEETEGTASVTVPAGMTLYAEYQGDPTYELSVDGVAHEFVAATGRNDTNKFEITNDTDAKKTYELKVALPVGTYNNPKVIESMEWYSDEVVQAAGDTEGYYYIYTATQTGDVTLYINAEYDDEGNVIEGNVRDIAVTNLNTYAQYSLLNDGVDYYGLQLVVPVEAGQQLQIITSWVEDAAKNPYPAGTYSWTGNFTYPAGSENNPIAIEWAWNETWTTATATVTVEADGTYYTGIAGMDLSVDGVATEMSETAAFMLNAGTYDLVLSTPEGVWNNPAQLVIGENTATVAAGSWGGYMYTWTAEEAGTLSLTMPSDQDWFYVINNTTTGVYGDGQWSDSDPVANPGTIEVAAGDVLSIEVNTYNSADPNNNPGGTVTFTAAFEAAEPEVDLSQYMITFAQMDLSAEAEVQFRYWLSIPEEVLNDDESYILLTKDGSFGEVEYKYTMAELRENGKIIDGYYVVSAGIASPEMQRGITLQAFYNGDQNYHFCNSKGVDKGTSFTFSAADYARTALSTGTAQQKELVKNILAYGGYAQKFFGVDAENPVYDILSEFGMDIPDVAQVTADMVEQFKSTATGSGATFSNFETVLDSAVYLRADFTLDAGVSVDDCTFVLSGLDDLGEPFTLELEPTLVSGNTYRVLIEDVPACYWDQMYTVTVSNAATGNTYVATMSILGYARQVIRRPANYSADLVALCQAMYLYNQAANTFFNK